MCVLCKDYRAEALEKFFLWKSKDQNLTVG